MWLTTRFPWTGLACIQAIYGRRVRSAVQIAVALR